MRKCNFRNFIWLEAMVCVSLWCWGGLPLCWEGLISQRSLGHDVVVIVSEERWVRLEEKRMRKSFWENGEGRRWKDVWRVNEKLVLFGEREVRGSVRMRRERGKKEVRKDVDKRERMREGDKRFTMLWENTNEALESYGWKMLSLWKMGEQKEKLFTKRKSLQCKTS